VGAIGDERLKYRERGGDRDVMSDEIADHFLNVAAGYVEVQQRFFRG
jgi:hypothetical protein